MSVFEICGSEPCIPASPLVWFQYQYYPQDDMTSPNPYAIKVGAGANWWWTRTAHWSGVTNFRSIDRTGKLSSPETPSMKGGVAPCFAL